jgi:hypothetical protein
MTLSGATSRISWAAVLNQRTVPSSSAAMMPVGRECSSVSASDF